jgi:hypothetical protein
MRNSKIRYTAVLLAALGLAGMPALAETNSNNSTANAASTAAAEATPPATVGISNAEVKAVLDQMKQLVQQQHDEIEQQRRELDVLKRQIGEQYSAPTTENASTGTSSSVAALSEAVNAVRTPASLSTANAAAAPAGPALLSAASPGQSQNVYTEAQQQEGALYLKIGGATFTPGGWVDFTSINRSTDVGSGFTTALGSIPFNNTVTGGLTESRLTAQNSRFSLRADETIGKIKAYGYVEADFNGYQPSNAFVSTNSDTLRLRVYYLNLTKNKWDVLGGQNWSLLTPNRVGLSPFLSEIYNTVHIDTAYNAGIVYARQAQLRAVYHFNEHAAFGLSVENSQQFTGSAATLPTLFSNTETDINSSTSVGGGTATPNRYPDVVAKLALDKKFGARTWHLEIAGLATPFAVTTPATTTKTGSRTNDSREGGGASVNGNFEVFHNFHLIADSFWSDGGGRYIGGLGPAFVVAQVGTVNSPFTVQTVHSGAGLGGFEWQATKSTLFSAVYGGSYFGRRYSIDPSTKTLVGYGYTGSANSNNRLIQEGTFSSVSTLWKNQSYGAVQVLTQTSYVVRTPWYVAVSSPKNAHVFMEWLDLRYVLP